MEENKRATIPSETQKKVLIEAGYRCAVPTCRTVFILDLHHIEQVKDGGGNEAANLIALCPTCHRLYHNRTISKDAIYAYKQVLASLSFAFDLVTIDLMLFLYKIKDDKSFVLKQDGVLQFARLIANGLAKYEWNPSSFEQIYQIGYRVSLSDRGLQLIEAWMSGNRRAVELAMKSNLPVTLDG